MKALNTEHIAMVLAFAALITAADIQQVHAGNQNVTVIGGQSFGGSVIVTISLEQLEQLRQQYKSNPYDPALKQSLASAVINHGRVLVIQKQYVEATSQFDYAEELFPDNPQPSFLRGDMAYGLKQYDLARTELEKARKLGGDHPEILFMLGKVYYDTDDIRQAVELWTMYAQQRPEDESIQKLLANAQKELDLDSDMGKGNSSRFILSYDAAVKSVAAKQILSILEDAYNQVGRDLSLYPESRVSVILYASKDYRDITGAPGWTGGLYDGKIRIPVPAGGWSEIPPQVRNILYHEYSHVVVRKIVQGSCPVWLNEGLAEIAGRTQFDSPLTALQQAVAKKKLHSLATVSGPFISLSESDVHLAYQQSYSLVRYMVTTYGGQTVKELLIALGEGRSFDTAAEQAFSKVGRSFKEIYSEWHERVMSGQES